MNVRGSDEGKVTVATSGSCLKQRLILRIRVLFSKGRQIKTIVQGRAETGGTQSKVRCQAEETLLRTAGKLS